MYFETIRLTEILSDKGKSIIPCPVHVRCFIMLSIDNLSLVILMDVQYSLWITYAPNIKLKENKREK